MIRERSYYTVAQNFETMEDLMNMMNQMSVLMTGHPVLNDSPREARDTNIAAGVDPQLVEGAAVFEVTIRPVGTTQ